MGFRVREPSQTRNFTKALKKQNHIANKTVFFQSVVDALIRASNSDEMVEWPIELVAKPKKR